MSRIISTASFILLSLTALASNASPASASQIHFRAETVTPAPAAARLVVRDTVFRCGESGCVAPRGAGRSEHVCSALAREVGALASFSAGGRALDAAALAECNRRAR